MLDQKLNLNDVVVDSKTGAKGFVEYVSEYGFYFIMFPHGRETFNSDGHEFPGSIRHITKVEPTKFAFRFQESKNLNQTVKTYYGANPAHVLKQFLAEYKPTDSIAVAIRITKES